jgi:hypothetical protein
MSAAFMINDLVLLTVASYMSEMKGVQICGRTHPPTSTHMYVVTQR